MNPHEGNEFQSNITLSAISRLSASQVKFRLRSSKKFEPKVSRKIIRVNNKVHIFWEGHRISQNHHLTFDYSTCSQKLGEDFAKFCGLIRTYTNFKIMKIKKEDKFECLLTSKKKHHHGISRLSGLQTHVSLPGDCFWYNWHLQRSMS